jgi:hypothetical protein
VLAAPLHSFLYHRVQAFAKTLLVFNPRTTEIQGTPNHANQVSQASFADLAGATAPDCSSSESFPILLTGQTFHELPRAGSANSRRG